MFSLKLYPEGLLPGQLYRSQHWQAPSQQARSPGHSPSPAGADDDDVGLLPAPARANSPLSAGQGMSLGESVLSSFLSGIGFMTLSY